jgi:hypothetical protein
MDDPRPPRLRYGDGQHCGCDVGTGTMMKNYIPAASYFLDRVGEERGALFLAV